MFAAPQLAPPVTQTRRDGVARALMIAAIVLAVVSIGSFAGYEYSLSTQASHLAAGAPILR